MGKNYFEMSPSEQDEYDKRMKKSLRDLASDKIKYEAHLENYFCEEVKDNGGWAVKFNPLGTIGLPDRIVFYKGFTWLVELKTERGTVQPHQKGCHIKFKAHGFIVRIIRNKNQVAEFVQDMLNLVP